MEVNLNELTVLVVDDYENVRRKVVAELKAMGVQVREATNGYEALASLRENPSDVVFSDIVMPEMDGFELCEEIRKIPSLRTLPIIITSTHCDSRYVLKALRHGADDYISKPVKRDVLANVLHRVLTPAFPVEAATQEPS